MTNWPHGDGEMAERIRVHDWAATALGPIAGWPQSLRNAVDLMIGSPQFATLAWGPGLKLFYNDACAPLLGDRHPTALGRRYTDVWRVQEGPEDVIGTTLGGRSTHYVDQFFETPSRPERPFGWFTGSRTPLRDETGAVVGFYVSAFETTERVLAERALRDREVQQAFLLKLSDALRPLADPAAIQGEACRRLGEQLGTNHACYVEIREADGLAVIEQDHVPGDGPSFVGTYALEVLHWVVPLYRKGRPIVVDDMATTAMVPEPERSALVADGIAAWIAIPLVKHGELVGALSVVRARPRAWTEAEIALVGETGERMWSAVERARAEKAARASDARLRTLVDAAPLLIWETDALGVISVNEHYKEFFGIDLPDVIEGRWTALVHPDDVEPYAAAFAEAFTRRRPFTHECRARRADGTYRWLSSSGRPSGETHFVGFSIDITDRRLAEERIKRSNALLQGINRIFGEALSAASEAELGRICREVTEEVARGALPLGASPGETPAGEHDDAAEALAPAIGHALLAKRAESQLRDSEARLRQFADASSSGLWIIDADSFAVEFRSPAARSIYGFDPAAKRGDIRNWASMIVPEDRAAALDFVERVRRGETVAHELRVLNPTDRRFRWIRNQCFPLVEEGGRVRRIGGIVSDVTEAKQAEQHQRVLLAELQHRVRNIMALIRSIVVRTSERAESVGDYASLVGGRLLTLARVQSRLTRAAGAGVPITAILRDEIGAQAECEEQYDLDGVEVELSSKAAEVLTLAVHELATNALKHGSLASARGRVSVRWHSFETADALWLSFDWTESGGPEPLNPATRRRGFGSELIERMIPYELSGRGRIDLPPGGAHCHLEFPLTKGASILETDAPKPGTVFGGALDITGEADLGGHRVLVVEDDFYLAGDVARALKVVGATVLGPCATETAALDRLGREAPTAAVIDIDLSGHPSFAVARALRDRAVPFVFVTGYDAEAIPPEFADVPRLEKPVELRRIVGDLARLLRVAAKP